MLDPNQPLNMLTVEEASNELRINVRTLYAMLADGRIKAWRPRGTDRTLIPRQELINLLEGWSARPAPNTGKKGLKDKPADTDAE